MTMIFPLAMAGLGAAQVALSVALFASVTMLVIALFSESGEIQISPQREAAILAGNADRETAFEKPVLRRLMWVLLIVASRLSTPKLKEWLRVKLVSSGNPKYYTVEEYLAVSMQTGLVVGMLVGLLGVLWTRGQVSLSAIAIGMLVGNVLRLLHIRSLANTRLRAISRQIPYSLDLISLGMGAGATFVEAVQTVVSEDVADPFNDELRALLAEMELGTTRRRALESMASRVPIEQLQAIVSSVIQAEELGTPLADALHSQAELLRLNRSVRAENLAAEAGVRVLIPCLLILIAVVLAVFAPWLLSGSKSGLL